MAGVKLLTKTDPQLCLKLAYRAAQDLGYAVTPIEDASKRFTATKGSPEDKAVSVAYTDSVLFSLPILSIGPNGGLLCRRCRRHLEQMRRTR